MSTIYGESPEIPFDNSYAGNNGIALFQVDEGESDTITSSDDEGSYAIGARIMWWIRNNGDGTYDGGITGQGWHRDGYANNPFAYYTDEEIWNIASSTGNLNSIFEQMDNVYMFAAYIYGLTPECISGTPY